jgi:PilZ domain
MAWPHERAHFRIEYPIRERPTFTVGKAVYSVVDCSERGLRFAMAGELPALGTRIAGRLRFSRGDELLLEGEVVRLHEQSVAILLAGAGIELRTIFDEQRYLRKRYPTRY